VPHNNSKYANEGVVFRRNAVLMDGWNSEHCIALHKKQLEYRPTGFQPTNKQPHDKNLLTVHHHIMIWLAYK